jgi:hypothetical protein
MERGAWSDERLDDRFDHIDRELVLLRTELREGFSGIRAELNELRTIMIRFNGGMIIGLVGVIAAILARGA